MTWVGGHVQEIADLEGDLAHTLSCCVTSGKLLNLSESWFLHLLDGECASGML